MITSKLLFFIKVPPPVTGATLMNERVKQSQYLHDRFDIRTVSVSYADSVSDIGNFRIKKCFLFINYYFKLLFELTFKKPDLVYFQISPSGVAFLRDLIYVTIIKIFGVTIIYHLRGKGIKEKTKSIFWKNLYRYCFNNEYIICLSTYLTFDVANVYTGKIFVVNNGIPDLKKNETDKSKGGKAISGSGKVNILFFSNLLKEKGIVDFVESLEELKKRNLLFTATITGAEADISKNELKKLLKKKNLYNQVVYTGPKYDQEKAAIYSSSDIFVFPTKLKHECFPGVILEAMQFEVPVVSTLEAAIPDIVDEGVTGFLVKINQPKKLADKIEILINNPDLRKKMGMAGRRKYKNKYTLEHFEHRLSEVFSKVLSCKYNNN